MVDLHAPVTLWRSARGLPEFWRLLELRVVTQFADGLFQAGLLVGLLFNPERGARPLDVAAASAALLLPYSLLGPFAGALLDRWDRRSVLIVVNLARLVLVVGLAALLAGGARERVVLLVALFANGLARFIGSGLSAALPHVVPRGQVVTMNSVAIATGAVAAFLGANFALLPRRLAGVADRGAAAVIVTVAVPVAVALFLSLRFAPRALGPDDTKRAIHGSVFYAVTTGWLHGVRTVRTRPTVAASLSGLVAHRMAIGVNTLLVLMLVRHVDVQTVAGLGTTALFLGAIGGGSFVANVLTPALLRRWGRYATGNGALAAAAAIQLAGVGLYLPALVACGFLLGAAGQVVKLCVDAAMQIDVDDPLRGHVFAVQDSLFWIAFVGAVTLAAVVIPPDGHAPALIVIGSLLYLAGLLAHGVIGRGPAVAG